MTLDQWLALLGSSGIWGGIISTVVITLSKRRAKEIKAIEVRLETKIDTLALQSAAEHRAVAAQVSTLQHGLADEFIRREEFDREARNTSEKLTQLHGDLRMIQGMLMRGPGSGGQDWGPRG